MNHGPVILDVNPNGETPGWEQDLLERHHLPVVTCCGPEVPGGCPLLRGERCPRLEKADGVLFQLDLDRGEHRHILGMYLRTIEVPIRVVITPEQKERWSGLLDLVQVLTHPIDPAAIDEFAAEVTIAGVDPPSR
jgi:hypothetical protein